MNVASRDYSIRLGEQLIKVDPSQAEMARQIDKDGDGVLQQSEIERFVSVEHGVSCSCCRRDRGVNGNNGDTAALSRELSLSLANVANPDRAGYHSYDSLLKDFDKLSESNPGYMQKVVVGKSPEGRDIVAYKVTEGAQGDTSSKTGVVITGCTHAREWVTVEAPLRLAQDLLGDIDKDPVKQQRLKDAEVWILPCANPDGYEYSRNGDSMWRKNRRPLEVDQLGKPTKAIGVDINRNFGDDKPEHEVLWRPDGDKPGNTWDDFSATSDNPSSETYRGPKSSSEPETQAMLDLGVRRLNVKGQIDYHSYGNDIFYPWDHTHDEPSNVAVYKEVGGKIANATGWSCAQGADLYLNSGDSTEIEHANGILAFCFEMGSSFQPSPSKIPAITAKASAGTMVFIDEVVARDKKGELPRTA